jgi:hypothetical protein
MRCFCPNPLNNSSKINSILFVKFIPNVIIHYLEVKFENER